MYDHGSKWNVVKYATHHMLPLVIKPAFSYTSYQVHVLVRNILNWHMLRIIYYVLCKKYSIVHHWAINAVLGNAPVFACD